jgi:hypothetical protein
LSDPPGPKRGAGAHAAGQSRLRVVAELPVAPDSPDQAVVARGDSGGAPSVPVASLGAAALPPHAATSSPTYASSYPSSSAGAGAGTVSAPRTPPGGPGLAGSAPDAGTPTVYSPAAELFRVASTAPSPGHPYQDMSEELLGLGLEDSAVGVHLATAAAAT